MPPKRPAAPPCAVYQSFVEARSRRDAGLAPWQWFDQRRNSHGGGDMMGGGPPLRYGEALAAWNWHTDTAASAKTQRCIYVHVPFCTRICSFCSFYREASRGDKHAAYTEALCNQIARVAQRPWTQAGPPFSAVYMGGGTPTSLSAEQLSRVVRCIRDSFPLAADAEYTVETRFDGVDGEYLDQLCAAGVNRFSFGVQTFDTSLRRRAGRIASGRRVRELLESVGDKALINCDLIANLPGQSVDSWHQDFVQLAHSPATSASVYALIPMRGSALVKKIEQGRHQPLAGLEFEYQLHQATVQAMAQRPDWQRYNFHHYGHRQRETNCYNGVRIGKMDTLALGSGAGGRIGGLNYMACPDVDQFIASPHNASHDCAMAFPGNPDQQRRSQASALVEGQYLSQNRLEDLLPEFIPHLDLLDDLGLLVRTPKHGHYSLSPLGDFWGYNILGLIKETVRNAT